MGRGFGAGPRVRPRPCSRSFGPLADVPDALRARDTILVDAATLARLAAGRVRPAAVHVGLEPVLEAVHVWRRLAAQVGAHAREAVGRLTALVGRVGRAVPAVRPAAIYVGLGAVEHTIHARADRYAEGGAVLVAAIPLHSEASEPDHAVRDVGAVLARGAGLAVRPTAVHVGLHAVDVVVLAGSRLARADGAHAARAVPVKHARHQEVWSGREVREREVRLRSVQVLVVGRAADERGQAEAEEALGRGGHWSPPSQNERFARI